MFFCLGVISKSSLLPAWNRLLLYRSVRNKPSIIINKVRNTSEKSGGFAMIMLHTGKGSLVLLVYTGAKLHLFSQSAHSAPIW